MQIFANYKTALIGFAVIAGGLIPVAAQAQEEKLTREPVFRQAKLAGQFFEQRLAEHELADRPIQPAQATPAQLGDSRNVTAFPVAASPGESIEKRVPGIMAGNVGALPPSDATLGQSAPEPKHPLDTAITVAEEGLAHIQANVSDYTALMVKRERVNGNLGDVEYIRIKVRNGRETEQGPVPFSIYMSFLKPRAVKGREVIWVKGKNDNKLSAHETGMVGFKTFHLDPDGFLAMRGNRYPIYEAGIENLVIRLIEKATRDRSAGDCEVQYIEGAKINNRTCKMIQVVHNERRAPYEFHKAQVFIDDEMNIPVRYASYDWPSTPGGKPVLMEEYTYINVDLNVGLTDLDFDITNPEYSYRESK